MTEPPEGIHGILYRFIVDGLTPEEAALKAQGLPDILELVHPLLVRQAQIYARRITQRVEQEVLPDWLAEMAEDEADRQSVRDTPPPPKSRPSPRPPSPDPEPVEQPSPAPTRESVLATLPEARRELVSKTFPLPNGERVPWLKATAAQHRMRAEWQRKRGLSCLSDARIHEVAAEQIEASGVECLEDLVLQGASL